MKMLGRLRAQDLLPMGLEGLTSSRAVSRAKTLVWPESGEALPTAQGPASGPKSSDLLAIYDPLTSSWKTSQRCFLAQLAGEAGGLAEFSETWPNAGMMRNGKIYRRQPWAHPIAESASGLWPTPNKMDKMKPRSQEALASALIRGGCRNLKDMVAWPKMFPTPTKSMHKGSSLAALTRKDGRDRSFDRLDHFLQALEDSGSLNPKWVEWLMGFPIDHTDLPPLETR